MGLTPKQKRVLEYIGKFSEKKGYAPSQQEIAKHFGYSSLGTVQNYLVRLEREGFLSREWNGKRSVEVTNPLSTLSSRAPNPSRAEAHTDAAPNNIHPLTPPQPLAVTLPLLGRVAAGRPIEAVPQDTRSAPQIDVPAHLATKGDEYALQVVGDSMIDDGIFENDILIVRKKSTASNGQTVVALLSGEATVKRYYQKKGQIELHPANAKYEPIIVQSLVGDEGPDFQIEGIVVGLIRAL